ncbi:MAG: acyltransferase [Cyanobacteriota bacterium]|nr:acyltransferase [Cyanobacteriota bacterium]
MVEHIKPLTSLRGIGALLILMLHFLYYFTRQLGQVIQSQTQFFFNGYLWVDFFFIMSGFVLTHVYVRTFSQEVTSKSYRSFIVARFARVYPLHFFMILPFLALEILRLFIPGTQPFTHTRSFIGLCTNLFMLQAIDLKSPPLFGGLTYWNEPAWSISAEFFVYLILPFILLFIWKRKSGFDLSFFCIGLVSLFAVVILLKGHLDFIGLPSLWRCFIEASFGVITYKIYYKLNERRELKQFLNSNLALLICGVWIFLVMHYNWNDVLVLPGFCLLILVASVRNNSKKGWVSQGLNSNTLVYLGEISYSIYLTHWFIQNFTGQVMDQVFDINVGQMGLFQSAIVLMFCLAVTLIISMQTYQWIEVPCRNYLRRKFR